MSFYSLLDIFFSGGSGGRKALDNDDGKDSVQFRDTMEEIDAAEANPF